MPNVFSRYPVVWIVALAALLFIPFLGGIHLFDWDEINFAEISREMILTGRYTSVSIDFQPFYQKPPLFSWLQVTAMHLFGIEDFAARLPNAICGIITLVLLFRIGKQLHNATFGWLWVGAYVGSILPHLYFRSGIIDPVFNLFIFLSLYFLIRQHWQWNGWSTDPSKRLAHIGLAGAFAGLAILTKGPVALALVLLTAGSYWISKRFQPRIDWLGLALFFTTCLLATSSWFAYEWWQNGPTFVLEFIDYQIRLLSTHDAGHKGFPGYHLVVLLIGCFPASIFALKGLFQSDNNTTQHLADWRRWMIVLLLVVLVVFSIVQSKIVHYSSLCYFPLTYLAALTLHALIQEKWAWKKWMSILLGSIGGIYVLVTIALPWLGQHPEWLMPLFSKDPFAAANMEADIPWNGFESLVGLVLLVTLILFFRSIRSQPHRAVSSLLVGSTCFITFTIYGFVGNIEAYSQRAAIEFYSERQGENCYIFTHGFKSYAHFWYSRKTPANSIAEPTLEKVLALPTSTTVYIATKITKVHELDAIPQLERLYDKNGFAFYQRK